MNILCKYCDIPKCESEFSPSQINKNFPICRICKKLKDSIYYCNNKEKIKNKTKSYYENNKETILLQQNEYKIKNKEKNSKTVKIYFEKNKKTIIEYKNKWKKERRKIDPCFKLKNLISRHIHNSLKGNGYSKFGKSSWKHLPYSPEELKQHIESLFEPWMNWENQGNYRPDFWDDNDSSTWKWQLDHIIPHSTFKYENMECEDFQKCWSLSNLRPLSGKQNVIEGANRSRHIKKGI